MTNRSLSFPTVIKMDRKSPGDGGLTFPDFSNPKIDRWDARRDIIALPSSIFNQGKNVNNFGYDERICRVSSSSKVKLQLIDFLLLNHYHLSLYI